MRIKSKHLTIRLDPVKVEIYKHVAKEDNRSLTNWIENTLDEEVKKHQRLNLYKEPANG